MSWIKSKKPLSVFVQNRLTEITTETNIKFRYINKKENPADLSSRGISSKDLKESKLWWNGPDWLTNVQESWPTWNVPTIDQQPLENIQSEIKGPTALYETSIVAQENASKLKDTEKEVVISPFGIKKENYSSLNKLLRVTAYAIRFVQKVKKIETPQGIPSSTEIECVHVSFGYNIYDESIT